MRGGLIHIGLKNYAGGRAGEPSAEGISGSLKSIGLQLGRLKTGTPARLSARSIDFEKLEVQYGDEKNTTIFVYIRWYRKESGCMSYR